MYDSWQTDIGSGLTVHRTKCDDGTLFLGDGSLAGVPTPKLGGKGIRPVIKVIDEKCLYVLAQA